MGLTTPLFWDCECATRFIHPRSVKACVRCKAERDEQPDAHVMEVFHERGVLAFDEHDIPPCGHGTARPKCLACRIQAERLLGHPWLGLVVYTPHEWRRREVLKHLRRYLLEHAYEPNAVNRFLLGFVQHWINRQGFKSYLREWGVVLVARDRNRQDTGSYTTRRAT